MASALPGHRSSEKPHLRGSAFTGIHAETKLREIPPHLCEFHSLFSRLCTCLSPGGRYVLRVIDSVAQSCHHVGHRVAAAYGATPEIMRSPKHFNDVDLEIFHCGLELRCEVREWNCCAQL